ncbi:MULTISPECIES: hypothetical protein [Roseomonadaceae]|uniref:Uncharacterized protein n=1 Tax=Falsiroseomonas oleicola TaxID=2801474 RepID=A0ABS6H7J0_9PROT|nr:hypothetical protein [Roseomonas oleicola]MBU8543698.1 hypothetical protein [Roseomonas oleicola]
MPQPVPRPPARPALFAERGCAVPFTAPLLAGARLRRQSPEPAELLLPGPGGTEVVAWDACLARRAPSLHDRQLWARISQQERPTPALIRAAAREVAWLGYAGRPAQAAALTAQRQQEAVRDVVREALAKAFGEEAAAGALLGPMVAILAQAGVGHDQLAQSPPTAAIPQGIVALQAFCASIAAFAQSAPGQAERRAASIALSAARMTLPKADACLAALWAAVAELPPGPARQAPQPAEVLPKLAALAARAEWLLDGWPMLGALWASADPAERGVLLAEMLSMLPVLPREAEGWAEDPPQDAPWDTLLRARDAVLPGLPEMPAGMWMARHEALRALVP